MRSFAAFNNKLAKRYDQWMVAMKYADRTKHQHQRGIMSFLAFIGKKPLTSVTHLDIREFMARLSNGGASLLSLAKMLAARKKAGFLQYGWTCRPKIEPTVTQDRTRTLGDTASAQSYR
jgi:site-specific recombinase XerC